MLEILWPFKVKKGKKKEKKDYIEPFLEKESYYVDVIEKSPIIINN